MSAIRLSISLLKTSTFPHKDKSEKHFLICLQSEDCNANLEIIFHYHKVALKNSGY